MGIWKKMVIGKFGEKLDLFFGGGGWEFKKNKIKRWEIKGWEIKGREIKGWEIKGWARVG